MEKMLSAEDAQTLVYSALEEFTGWKFLKGQRCLKKKVKDLELCIYFHTSKWNQSYEYVGLNADFRIVYKKLGKLPVQNTVGYYEYRPHTGDDRYWFDISTIDRLTAVTDVLKTEIQKTALKLAEQLEEDLKAAVRSLLDNHFDEYHIRLEFAADILGPESVMPRAKAIAASLTDEEKQQISDYRNGKRTKTWMLNPTNLKYIADNNLIEGI